MISQSGNRMLFDRIFYIKHHLNCVETKSEGECVTGT